MDTLISNVTIVTMNERSEVLFGGHVGITDGKIKIPVMVIGGGAGSFLGEYQAGGVIIVLGLEAGNGNLFN